MLERRTRVYLTVDVECAEERVRNGVLQPALDYDLRVWGRFKNQREKLGVPLILETFRRQGFAGTFFLEPFGADFFGEAGFAEICAYLRRAEQDVQLHAHPVQKRPDWFTRKEPRASDDIGAYSLEEQVAMLRDGIRRLAQHGIDPDGVVAFRAGNYGASNDTWRAMQAVGLKVSSSFNLSYLDKNCRLRWPTSENALFATDVAGVWELPVSNMAEGGGSYRHVEITALSFPEMRHYLLESRRLGIPEVTVVMHPFEFFFVDSVADRRGRPNWVNVERLRGLVDFLGASREAFQVDTAGALARRLAGGEEQPVAAARGRLPRGRTHLRWARLAGQVRQRVAKRVEIFP